MNEDRHLCVFDELYSGTNPEEATKSSYAFLKYLAKYKHLDFILTTHILTDDVISAIYKAYKIYKCRYLSCFQVLNVV